MKIASLGFALLGLMAAPAALMAGTQADTAFEDIAHRYIEDYLRLNPEDATELGDHRYDGRLSDYSAAGLKAVVDLTRSYLAQLGAIDPAQLTGANRIDVQILRSNLEYQIFTLEQLRPQENNPRSYNGSLADGIYVLTARETLPAAERLRSLASRLAGIPAVIGQAKANLRTPARVYTETAIDQTGGAINLVRDDLEPLLKQAPEMRAELAPIQEKAIAALTAYKTWLKDDLLPRSTGDFRLGEKLYRQKLRFALNSDLTPEQILARAEAGLAKTTDEIYATAKPLYLASRGAGAKAADVDNRPLVIKTVLNRLSEKSLTDVTIVTRAQEILKDATEFVRSHQLVTVPETPVRVIVAPEFNRGASVAYCQSPGALEPQGETFFAIAPTPTDWPEARKRSFYREYNDYMLHDLTVHEAMPGHYLQLAHSNQFKAPTLVRALFSSGTFVEGWAVYTERVMAETGFGGPEVRMQQLKMRLRAIINAIIDQKIHMGTMTEKEAIDLMMQQGFQEEGEAVGKWKRARLTSTQLSTYFVGATEHDDLRAAAEAKWGARFDLKKYHDTVISFGSPPVKFVRQEMGLE
ncbi:MAG: hypothetical protein JWM88_3407 [Verrucomicrobia bacterium]|nr:hypothetical protein [Verrucomicrobiota bacterium]